MMSMEANDNRTGPSFEDRKAFLMALVENLEPGADGRAGRGAIIRELEQLQPGLIDQHHARLTARRLRLDVGGRSDVSKIDWADVEYAGA